MKKESALSTLFILYFGFLCAFPTLYYIFSIGNIHSIYVKSFWATLPEILGFGLVMYFCIKHYQENIAFEINFFDKLLLAYFIFSLIYGSIRSLHLNAIAQGIRMSYFPFIFYIIGRLIPPKLLVKQYIDPLFALFGILAIIGFVLYFFVPHFNLEMIEKISGIVNKYLIVRMTSILWTPVVFGTLMGLSVLYYNLKYLENGKLNANNWLFLIFCWLGVFLSVSRGPIICSVLLSCLMILYFGSNQLKWRLIVLICTIYVLSIVLASIQQQILYNGGSFIALFINMVNFTISSASETVMLEQGLTRVELWRKSWQHFMMQPWGYGIGKSGHVAWRLFKDTTTPSSPYSTDGYYLKLLGEQGIVGFTFFSYLIIMVFLKIKTAQIFVRSNFYSFFVFIFLFILIQNLVSNVLDYYIIAPLFYFALGALIKHAYEHKT